MNDSYKLIVEEIRKIVEEEGYSDQCLVMNGYIASVFIQMADIVIAVRSDAEIDVIKNRYGGRTKFYLHDPECFNKIRAWLNKHPKELDILT